eukprot:7760118-Alexandrium_andersonii.AAC.1
MEVRLSSSPEGLSAGPGRPVGSPKLPLLCVLPGPGSRPGGPGRPRLSGRPPCVRTIAQAAT